ncbi:MAG: transposase [Opitutus sp.]|nr:transposase [Opitutus sp.]
MNSTRSKRSGTSNRSATVAPPSGRNTLRDRWRGCVDWSSHCRSVCCPRSGLGQACTYLLGQWTPLTTHVRHSQTKLDTNAVENAIRPSKLGAKNWLFVGHPDAGDRAAVIYSLVVSCQRHGHDPHAYLRDVLTRLPAMTTADDLRPLLPAHWRTAASPS